MSTFSDPDSVAVETICPLWPLDSWGMPPNIGEEEAGADFDRRRKRGEKVQGLSETLNIGEFAAWMEEEAREKVISQRGSKPSKDLRTKAPHARETPALLL